MRATHSAFLVVAIACWVVASVTTPVSATPPPAAIAGGRAWTAPFVALDVAPAEEPPLRGGCGIEVVLESVPCRRE